MRDELAETIAEAEAQKFAIPAFDDWFKFAHLLDGYGILKEMGYEDWGEWYHERRKLYDDGQLSVTMLEARLILFLIARGMRFGGDEPYRLIDFLLAEIARQTGQPYTRLTEEDIEARIRQHRA